MRKNPGKYRKWCSILYTILLIGSLLLSGCASQPNEQGQTQPPETTKAEETAAATQDTQPDETEAPVATQGTQPDETEPTTPDEDWDDSSLEIFRQSMVETPQLFAAAYFGYVPQDADPFAVMRESAPQLCEDLPFLMAIREENIMGTFGYLFCIVPADENATVAVNRRPWNPQTESYEEPQVLYRSESGSPILVMCPNEDWIPDTEVIITDSNGTVTIWSPYLDPGYHISVLRNDNGACLIFDFTSYDELPEPG